ncbi:uncharacterized protein LOC112184376 isoform X1 [Rosa chinensis]|uniref:uncharacterized protein LOC112184376 isoform X1 n=1 Tax=Rosa chinensis TaxID=74649 RepID=UPI001AD8EF57|nr:uncharacterized protein LOC112184376 isoform X1 [Rosa chinensis]XP_040368475.1 uncharacterized protein LOC112184376 isoform X1 [Rosa chinensis]
MRVHTSFPCILEWHEGTSPHSVVLSVSTIIFRIYPHSGYLSSQPPNFRSFVQKKRSKEKKLETLSLNHELNQETGTGWSCGESRRWSRWGSLCWSRRMCSASSLWTLTKGICMGSPIRPLCAVPMCCLICSKFLDHMTEDCPHLHDESYSDRRWKVFHAPFVVKTAADILEESFIDQIDPEDAPFPTDADILEESFIDEIDPEDAPFPTDADILEQSFIDEIDPEDAPFPTDALVAEFSSFSTDALGAACRPKPSMVEKFSNNGDAATV